MYLLLSLRAFGRSTIRTSETKAFLLAAVWTLASLIPGVPIALPDIDLSSVGMGVLTLSPASLIAYGIVRCGIKVFTKGATPFLPFGDEVELTVPAPPGGTVALLASAAILGLALSTPADAAPGRWSLSRVSGGLSAQGAIVDTPAGRTSAFLPGAALTYTAASNLAVAVTGEYDWVRELALVRGGIRFKLGDFGKGTLHAGANAVSYSGPGAETILEATAWSASLHGDWVIARNVNGAAVLYGIASGEYDPENERETYRLGLRWRAFGGTPWAE